MNSTTFIETPTYLENSTTTIIESWFIPIDVIMIVCNILVIILSTFFLFIIIIDKTCHTVSIMLIANSCLTELISGCVLLGSSVFTLENDFKQIQYQDSLCVYRGYNINALYAALNFSFLLQAIYRYVTVVYSTRLFWQTSRIQILLISISWILALIYPIPFVFTNEIIYNVDNQICQVPLQLSFSTIYISLLIYTIPISLIMCIYFKLVKYVHVMGKHVTTANTLFRAQRELKMVRRIIIVVTIVITVGFPYAIFSFMSFFNRAPKYHFRIAFVFVDLSLVFVMIALFQFTEPLKTSIMKRIKWRPNLVVPRMT